MERGGEGNTVQSISWARGIDAQLGRDVAAATKRARGTSLTPSIFGREGRDKDARTLRNIPAAAAAALKRAGHHGGTLASLRLSDLGAAASKMTLAHVDLLHREALRATYHGIDLPKGAIDTMVRHGMPAWEMLDFIGPCTGIVRPQPGLVFEPGIDWDRYIDVGDLLDRLRDIVNPYRGVRFPVPPRPPEEEPDWRGPFSDGHGLDGLGQAVDVLPAAEIRLLLQRDATKDGLGSGEGEPGEMLAAAQAMALRGDRRGALELVARTASMDDGRKLDRAAYQRRVVAPTIAAAISGPSPSALSAARSALAAAPAGTAALTIAHRAAVRSAASQARRARSAAGAPGIGRRARRRAAIDATIDVASARYLDGVDARPAAALETATAMMDFYRAYAAAMNGVSTTPAVLRHGRPTYPKGGQSASDILKRGPSAYLGDPTLRMHAFESFLGLYKLCKADVGCGAWDLFRFDYLADEARKLLDDLARIDQLAVELIELLYQAALAGIGAEEAFFQQLDELLQRLVSDINAAASTLRDTIAAAVPRLRDLGALQAIYELLKSWPWDNWAIVIRAVGGAFASGSDPAIAARDAIAGRLGTLMQRRLGEAKTQIISTLGALERRMRERLQPDPDADSEHPMVKLRATLTTVLGDGAAEALKPLDDALAGINFVAIAQPILEEIDAATADEIPAWLKTLLLLYVAAPFIAALAAAAGPIIRRLFGLPLDFAGAVAAAVCAFIVTALVQLGVAIVLQLLSGLLSRAGEIQAEVNRLVTRLGAIGDDLVAALAVTAMMQSGLDAAAALIKNIGDAFPPEINSALSDAVLAARTAMRTNLGTVLQAVEDSFFRETLEVVEVLPSLEEASTPGMYDPSLGYANRLAAALSRFEAERIRRLTEPAQVLTQVISLRQILSATVANVDAAFAGLLSTANVLSFKLGFEDLDRVAPGLHRQLIRDVQLQIDFDLDSVPLSPPLTAPTGGAITRADAVAAIIEENTALAGGLSDPALDGAVPGGGFRGLPVIPGRIPTGIPALLTHEGISTFKIKDVQTISEAADRGSRLVAGVTLEPDPDTELAALGWHRLTICELPQQQLFSHFRVLEDGVRFFDPEKEVNPFEFRSIVGSWKVEIPALKLGFVTPQLPPIRDVRLIVSTVARYDSSLASGIRLPALTTAVVEPDPAADDDLQDLLANPLAGLQTALATVANLLTDLLASVGVVGQLPTLIAGLQAQLQALAGQVAALTAVAQGTTEAVEDMKAELDAAIEAATAELAAKLASLETALDAGFASLSGDIGSLGDKLDEIGDISATTAGLLADLSSTTSAPAVSRQLRVLTLSSTDPAVLTGTAKSWSVDQAMLTARGISGAATIAWVAVTALPSQGSAVGGLVPGTAAPAWPAAPAELSFSPASGGVAQTAQLVFDSPTASVDGTTLGGGTAAASPVGTWSLDLPANMPALTEAIVAIFLETS